MTTVEIITIGDELLIGQVIDTNSAWMAVELNKAGFDIPYKTTVGDKEADLLDAFERALSRVDVVLVTGGIGPTKDDITKQTLCQFFNTRLVFDEPTLSVVQEVVWGIGKELNELTRNQAYVPEGATIIQNMMGTAPITWFEREGKVLVSMPGVPFEMKWIMSNEVIPRLIKAFPIRHFIQHRTFLVKNYGESQLALHIHTWEDRLPDYMKLAYLPNSGIIRLRLTGKSDNEAALQKEMIRQKDQLFQLLGSAIVTEEDTSLEQLIHQRLQEQRLTLSLAESCTGGKLASLFTTIPGASAYFRGGVVTYSNEAKQDILGVRQEDIEQQGAVSKIVVEQMALGTQRIFHSDCAIAVSGIAGPDGGTPDKPVGTVWIAVAFNDQLKAEKFQFSKNREHNILRASTAGMLMLLDCL